MTFFIDLRSHDLTLPYPNLPSDLGTKSAERIPGRGLLKSGLLVGTKETYLKGFNY